MSVSDAASAASAAAAIFDSNDDEKEVSDVNVVNIQCSGISDTLGQIDGSLFGFPPPLFLVYLLCISMSPKVCT